MIVFFPHPTVQITKGSIGHHQWPAFDLFLIRWCVHCFWAAAFHRCLPAALFTVVAIVLHALYNIFSVSWWRIAAGVCLFWCSVFISVCARMTGNRYLFLLIYVSQQFIFIIEIDTICVIAWPIWWVVMEFRTSLPNCLKGVVAATPLWSLHTDCLCNWLHYADLIPLQIKIFNLYSVFYCPV